MKELLARKREQLKLKLFSRPGRRGAARRPALLPARALEDIGLNCSVAPTEAAVAQASFQCMLMQELGAGHSYLKRKRRPSPASESTRASTLASPRSSPEPSRA